MVLFVALHLGQDISADFPIWANTYGCNKLMTAAYAYPQHMNMKFAKHLACAGGGFENYSIFGFSSSHCMMLSFVVLQ